MPNKDTGGPVDGRQYTYEAHFDDIGVPDQKRMSRESAERCLYFLATSAEPHAAWSSRRKFLDKYVGIVLAMEESKIKAGSAVDKTRKAKKSIPYMRVLRDVEEAVYHETLLSGLRLGAEKKFSGWQSINATARTGAHV